MAENNFTPTSLAPWLTPGNAAHAVAFYKAAFGATETYRLDVPDGGMVVRLSVDGAEFWVSGDAGNGDTTTASLHHENIRMILTVSNPDTLFERALRAGATEIFPVGEEHGWRLGRLADPFGLHWEIGRPLPA